MRGFVAILTFVHAARAFLVDDASLDDAKKAVELDAEGKPRPELQSKLAELKRAYDSVLKEMEEDKKPGKQKGGNDKSQLEAKKHEEHKSSNDKSKSQLEAKKHEEHKSSNDKPKSQLESKKHEEHGKGKPTPGKQQGPPEAPLPPQDPFKKHGEHGKDKHEQPNLARVSSPQELHNMAMDGQQNLKQMMEDADQHVRAKLAAVATPKETSVSAGRDSHHYGPASAAGHKTRCTSPLGCDHNMTRKEQKQEGAKIRRAVKERNAKIRERNGGPCGGKGDKDEDEDEDKDEDGRPDCGGGDGAGGDGDDDEDDEDDEEGYGYGYGYGSDGPPINVQQHAFKVEDNTQGSWITLPDDSDSDSVWTDQVAQDVTTNKQHIVVTVRDSNKEKEKKEKEGGGKK